MDGKIAYTEKLLGLENGLDRKTTCLKIAWIKKWIE
jgi:hypothetical protein